MGTQLSETNFELAMLETEEAGLRQRGAPRAAFPGVADTTAERR